MSSCDNCKFTEWCRDKADDIRWCVEKSNLNNAYQQGRAEGYSKAENDYFKKNEEILKQQFDNGENYGYCKGRADAEEEVENRFNRVLDDEKMISYQQGRADAIDEFWTEFDKQIKSKGKQTHFYTEFLRIGMNIKEQLKGAEE